MHFPRDPDGSDFETSPILRFGEVSNALIQRLSARFQQDATDGTDPAVNTITLGVPADSGQRSRRGGARNSAARLSDSLSVSQIDNLVAAESHARLIGLPFTRMTTIHWEAAGVPLEGMTKATGHFIDLFTKMMTRHGRETATIWVHENGVAKGWHSHLLMHVPADLVARLTHLQRGWLRRITGKPYKSSVIHSSPIGGRLGNEITNPEHHWANLDSVLRYLLKGASEAAAERFDLERIEPGGLIIGKRCGTSQNIGKAARAGQVSATD